MVRLTLAPRQRSRLHHQSRRMCRTVRRQHLPEETILYCPPHCCMRLIPMPEGAFPRIQPENTFAITSLPIPSSMRGSTASNDQLPSSIRRSKSVLCSYCTPSVLKHIVVASAI